MIALHDQMMIVLYFVFFMDSFGLLEHTLVAARENPSGSNFDSWPRSQTCCAETLQSRTTIFNVHIARKCIANVFISSAATFAELVWKYSTVNVQPSMAQK